MCLRRDGGEYKVLVVYRREGLVRVALWRRVALSLRVQAAISEASLQAISAVSVISAASVISAVSAFAAFKELVEVFQQFRLLWRCFGVFGIILHHSTVTSASTSAVSTSEVSNRYYQRVAFCLTILFER